MEKLKKAVEETSDVIGEMLVASAEGKQEYSYEDIAAAALKIGIISLLEQGPSQSRVEEVAKIIYENVHDPKRHNWTSLNQTERVFWNTISYAATSISDREFKREVEDLSSPWKPVD